MKYLYKGLSIVVVNNYDEISYKAAQIVSAQVTVKPNSVLGLPTGSTPIGMYQYLVKMSVDHLVDFSEVVTFNLDEYLGINQDNPQSYAYFMKSHFFSHIDIPIQNQYIPDGMTINVDATCEAYDAAIFSHHKIDLQVLGIGINGHIGFNEPDIKFEAGTHLVKLDQATIRSNSRFFQHMEDVPREAISIGIKNIMQSRKVILLASGKNKAEIIQSMLFGPITPVLPASILQVHPDVMLILDQDSASLILPVLRQAKS
jgi:glucosamine-6-phosphate deaminase